MNHKTIRTILLLSLTLIFAATITLSTVKANPVEVSWYVTDVSSVPIDGARLTIYWSTSTSGPFSMFPADGAAGYIIDKINGVTTDPPGPPKMSGPKQNPIISGYWNPDHTHGMAICDLHPNGGLSGLYFYAKIEYDSTVEYWPTATSYKLGDPSWTPTVAGGSPSGYAAAGPGIGNGPTTAYPTHGPPPPQIPEVPLGPIIATVSMIAAFGVFYGFKKQKLHIPKF
jgi:hypothetical protein